MRLDSNFATQTGFPVTSKLKKIEKRYIATNIFTLEQGGTVLIMHQQNYLKKIDGNGFHE